MVGLREVSRQLKQAQEGIKACAAGAGQERGRGVREAALELSACMKELNCLTGVARGRLGAGGPSFLVRDSDKGGELPLSQEIPLQGHTHHQAPPPAVHTHQGRGGMTALQPTPLLPRPPAPKEPRPSSGIASAPTQPALVAVQMPVTVTHPPPMVPDPVVPHCVNTCLSMTDGQVGVDTSAVKDSSCGGGVPVTQGSGTHLTQRRHRATSPKAGTLPSEEGSCSKSADFAETVPLQVLLREGLLSPELSSLSTGIMVRTSFLHISDSLHPAMAAPPLPLHRVSSLWPRSVLTAACPYPLERSSHSHTSGSTPAGRRLGTGASGPRRARPTRW